MIQLLSAATGPVPTASRGAMDFTAEHKKLVQSLVAGVLRRSLSDPDVEDCTSETFRRALESAERLRSGEPLRPWLLGIARHVALDALRSAYRSRSRTAAHFESGGEGSDPVSLLIDTRPDPEVSVGSRRDAHRLIERLRSLPPEQQEAILLFHVEGLGYRAIAERLGVPVGSVGTWILRARNFLRDSFEDEEMTTTSGRFP